MTLLRLLAILFLLTPGLALAQPAAPATEPDYPVVRVGMVSYLQYAAELENRDGFNTFDLTRGYLNINAQVARTVRFRFTPDVRRAVDGSLAGSLVVRIKYGFAQFDDQAHGAWLRLGLAQTPWLDFEESVNRYRVQGTMFAEREGLIPGSADFGVGYFRPLPNGFGEIHGGVYNGEGFGQAEANKYKSIQGRLSIRPLPNRGVAHGLRVSGFYNAGWYARDRPRHLGILMGSLEHTNIVATLQRVVATERPDVTGPRDINRRGSSAFIELRQGPSGWAALARLDVFDPDRSFEDDSRQRVIAGGAYWFVWPRSRLGIVATNERVSYDALAERADENRLLLQTHVEF